MTTGNVNLNRIVGVAPAGSIAGYSRLKVWSGTDWPKVEVHVDDVPLPDIREYRYVRDPITKKMVRILWKEQTNRHKLVYRRPLKRSLKVVHNYTVTGTNTSVDTGCKSKCPSIGYASPGFYYNPFGGNSIPAPVDPWSANDNIALWGKVRNRLVGSEFNAAVFMGEAGKSLSMITDASSRIYRAYNALRKGNVSRAAQQLIGQTGRVAYRKHKDIPLRDLSNQKALADSWLELQYGWLPLVGDMGDAAQFVAHQLSAPLAHTVVVTHFHNGKLGVLNTYPNIISSGNANWKVYASDVESSRRVWATLREKNVLALSGVADWRSVAWELLPWSFVADWAIPIGAYMHARGVVQLMEGKYVLVTRVRRRLKGPVTKGPADMVIDPVYNQKGSTQEYYSFTRTLETSLALPLPQMKPLGDWLSWKRAANAVSLLVSRHSS